MADSPKSDNKSTLKSIESLINRARKSSAEEGIDAWSAALSACKEALNNDRLKGNNFAYELVKHYTAEAEAKISEIRKSVYDKHISIAKEYLEEIDSSSDTLAKKRLVRMASNAVEEALSVSYDDPNDEASALKKQLLSIQHGDFDSAGETVIIDPITLELTLLKESVKGITDVPLEKKELELTKILDKCSILEKYTGIANRQDIMKQLMEIKAETRHLLQKLYSYNNSMNSLPPLLDSISKEFGRSKLEALSNLTTTIDHIISLNIGTLTNDISASVAKYKREYDEYRIAVSELDELCNMINTDASSDSIVAQLSICTNNPLIIGDSSLSEELRNLHVFVNSSKTSYDGIEGIDIFNRIKTLFNSISIAVQFPQGMLKQLDSLLSHIETSDLAYKQGLVDGFLYKLSPILANSADARSESVVLIFKEIKHRFNEYIAYSEYLTLISSIQGKGSSLLQNNDDCMPIYDDIIASLQTLGACSYAQFNRNMFSDIETRVNHFINERDKYRDSKYIEYMRKANINDILKLKADDDLPTEIISHSVELINKAKSFADINSPKYEAAISAITRLKSLESDYAVTKAINEHENNISELKTQQYADQVKIAKQGIVSCEQLVHEHKKTACTQTLKSLDNILERYRNALIIAEYLVEFSNIVSSCTALERASSPSLIDWDKCISQLSYLNSSDTRLVPDKSGYTAEHYLTLAVGKRGVIVKTEYETLLSEVEAVIARASKAEYSDAASLLSDAITLLNSAIKTRYASENREAHDDCKVKIEELSSLKKKTEAMSKLSEAFMSAEEARCSGDSHSEKLWNECLRIIAVYRTQMELDTYSINLLDDLEKEANYSLLSCSFERDFKNAEVAILKASKQPFLTSAPLWENAFILCKQLFDHAFTVHNEEAQQRAYDLNKVVEAKRKLGSKLIYEDIYDSAKKSRADSLLTSDIQQKLLLLTQAIYFAKKAIDSEYFTYSNQNSELTIFINGCQLEIDELYKKAYISDLISRFNKSSLITEEEQLAYLDSLIIDISTRMDETSSIDNPYLSAELSSLLLKTKDKYQLCKHAELISSTKSLFAIAQASPSVSNWDSAEKSAKLATEFLNDKISKDKREEARLLYLDIIEAKRASCLSEYNALLNKANDLYRKAINNTGSDSISLFTSALTAIRQAKTSSMSQYGESEVSEAIALEKDCCSYIDRCRAIITYNEMLGRYNELCKREFSQSNWDRLISDIKLHSKEQVFSKNTDINTHLAKLLKNSNFKQAEQHYDYYYQKAVNDYKLANSSLWRTAHNYYISALNYSKEACESSYGSYVAEKAREAAVMHKNYRLVEGIYREFSDLFEAAKSAMSSAKDPSDWERAVALTKELYKHSYCGYNKSASVDSQQMLTEAEKSLKISLLDDRIYQCEAITNKHIRGSKVIPYKMAEKIYKIIYATYEMEYSEIRRAQIDQLEALARKMLMKSRRVRTWRRVLTTILVFLVIIASAYYINEFFYRFIDIDFADIFK